MGWYGVAWNPLQYIDDVRFNKNWKELIAYSESLEREHAGRTKKLIKEPLNEESLKSHPSLNIHMYSNKKHNY